MTARDLRWDDLKVLLAIARRGSLAGAAHELGMNVSTVSRRLIALEKALGNRLFDRTRDGVIATSSAARILTIAERLADEAERLTQGPVDDPSEGVVRIASSPGIAEAYVVPALGTFGALHPKIAVEVHVHIGVKSLDRREADIAVRLVKPELPGLIKRHILRLPYALLASPGYTAKLGRLERWCDARWVSWTQDLPNVPAARWFATHVRGVVPALRINNFEGQLVAVRGGHCIAVMPGVYTELSGFEVVHTGAALREACAALPTDDVWLVADPVQKAPSSGRPRLGPPRRLRCTRRPPGSPALTPVG